MRAIREMDMQKYKITKTIRFKLEAETMCEQLHATIQALNKKSEFDLAYFITQLKCFCDDMKKYLFFEKGNELEVDGKLIIKKEWLRTYAKQALADVIAEEKANVYNQVGGSRRPRREQSTIDNYKDLKLTIKEVFDDVDTICADLATDASAELSERSRRAHTGLLLQRLSAKRALPCLVSLVENTSKKNEIDDLSVRLKYFGAKLLQQLTFGTCEYLPAQSNGIPIAKASFNYYTINKKPADYSKIVEDISHKLLVTDLNNLPYFKFNFPNKLKESITEDIKAKSNNKQLLLGDSPFADKNTASLRQILKNIKAEQKSKFQEFMNDNHSLKDLQEHTELYLFNNITQAEFEEYADLTKQIEAKATSINQCSIESQKRKLRSDMQHLKKLRGKLLKDNFNTYKTFASFYGYVAKNHGRLLAQLKGIEKERAESQLLNYWALILEQDGTHKLVLVPKEEANEFRKKLNPSTENNLDNKIFWFESLTFRSLRKLCFGNLENGTHSNTFNPEIKKEIQVPNGEFEFQGDEQQKIKFYQEVLNTNYAKQVLDLPQEVNTRIIGKNFDSLYDFIIALEKICYRRFSTVDENTIKELKRIGAQVFNITSLDLRNEKNSKDKVARYAHTDKMHTQIWKNFWSVDNENNNFDIRLNPEIIISYRKPKESRIVKYGKESKLFDQNKKNRYLHEQFALITTISEHCNTPAKDLSFVSDDDFKKSIEEFNKTLTEDKVKFALGLDNGEVELSTLGIYLPQFDRPTNKEKIVELKKTKEYGFQVFKIKDLLYSETDLNGKTRKIIQNPSYFVKEDVYCRTFGKTKEEYEKMFANVFEEKYLLTLDLTTAKVIDGKIIENGDVISLFNLWMRHAERNIYEMNDHAKKETAKTIILKKSDELNDEEKAKFIDYLNEGNKKYAALSDAEKATYVTWIYDVWNEKIKEEDNDKFKKVKNECKRKGTFVPDDKIEIVFAVCKIGEDIESVKVVFDVRNVFKLRKGEFDTIKTEKEIFANLEKYNKRTISNEELDLQINQRKESLVANVIGVVDFLYKQYQNRFGGEGIIVKEGFDHGKVAQDREKFSGNIYRLLERKLYQKFQNYGLVPPIKNLMLVREDGVKNDKSKIMRLGNICFVDPDGTSQICPVCEKGKLVEKGKLGDKGHGTECTAKCGLDISGIMHSNDAIAGFNIAKRGFNNFN